MSVVAVETRSVSAVDLRGSTESLAPTFRSWLLSVRETASAPTRPRFSVLKAKQLIKYLQKTSSGRQVLVVCMSTVPGLLASLAMPLIPLQDPSLGIQRNAWFYLHLSLTIGYSVAASVTTACAVAGISSDEYTGWAVSAVSLITTALLVVMFLFLGLYWRFPVPFAPVLVYAPWFVCISIAHIIVLRGKLRSQRLRNGLLFYMPSLCVQVSQLLIYPAYSAFFHASNQRVQILLIGCFPLIKYGIKRNVYLTLAHVKDYAKEEAVGSVEICASMYQSMIVQGTPSSLATGLVIAVDVVLGVIDIHRLEHRKAVLPSPQLLTSGIALLRDSTLKHDDDHLQSFATRTDGWLKNTHLRRSCRRWLNVSIAPLKPESAASDRNVLKRSTRGLRSDPLVLVQTLEMLQSVETILMVEYFEVIVPAMNVVYVAIASQLPSAAYNYKLRPLVSDLGKLEAAVANMLLYTALQLATLVVVSVIVRVRYSLSPLALIAFALEKHACSLQGKLVAWLPTIMAFSIVHYGVDFFFPVRLGHATGMTDERRRNVRTKDFRAEQLGEG